MANKTGPKPRHDARRNPINVRIDDQTLADLQRLAAVTAQTVGTLAAQILASGVAQSGDSAAQSAQIPKDAPPCRISSASLTDSVCATLGESSSEAE